MTNTTAPTATGDVFVSSWGYEQTNVDYYEVTRTTDKSIWVRPIRSTVVTTLGSMSGTVAPVPGDYIGAEFRRRRPERGNGFSVNSFALARPWDGQPSYSSSYA